MFPSREKTAALSLAFALLAGPALAESWAVNKDESTLGFVGTQQGKEFTGGFSDFDATIAFDPADPAAGSADVVIRTESFSSGSKQRDEAAVGKEWFNVKKFETARFQASGFRAVGENSYEADGKLTIRDVTKDVTLPFTLTIDGDTAKAQGELTVDRQDYGLGTEDFWLVEAQVGKEVTITLDLTAARAD